MLVYALQSLNLDLLVHAAPVDPAVIFLHDHLHVTVMYAEVSRCLCPITKLSSSSPFQFPLALQAHGMVEPVIVAVVVREKPSSIGQLV